MNIDFISCDECHDDAKKDLVELQLGGNYITLCPDCLLHLFLYLDDWHKGLKIETVVTDDDLIASYYSRKEKLKYED